MRDSSSSVGEDVEAGRGVLEAGAGHGGGGRGQGQAAHVTLNTAALAPGNMRNLVLPVIIGKSLNVSALTLTLKVSFSTTDF